MTKNKANVASAKGGEKPTGQGPDHAPRSAATSQKKPAEADRPLLDQRREGLKPDELNAANDK